MTTTADMSLTERMALIEQIVSAEWNQFQKVNNEGGRANCQGNWPTFNVMRTSQFLTWDDELLDSYAHDLEYATQNQRNLIMEKYAWMMASTDPEYFARELEEHLPALSAERITLQEQIIAQQLVWAKDFHKLYPHVGEGMRVMETTQDTRTTTSFETYLRGELSTYSLETLDRYAQMVERMTREDYNLTAHIVEWTVKLSGYESLEDAEKALEN